MELRTGPVLLRGQTKPMAAVGDALQLDDLVPCMRFDGTVAVCADDYRPVRNRLRQQEGRMPASSACITYRALEDCIPLIPRVLLQPNNRIPPPDQQSEKENRCSHFEHGFGLSVWAWGGQTHLILRSESISQTLFPSTENPECWLGGMGK